MCFCCTYAYAAILMRRWARRRRLRRRRGWWLRRWWTWRRSRPHSRRRPSKLRHSLRRHPLHSWHGWTHPRRSNTLRNHLRNHRGIVALNACRRSRSCCDCRSLRCNRCAARLRWRWDWRCTRLLCRRPWRLPDRRRLWDRRARLPWRWGHRRPATKRARRRRRGSAWVTRTACLRWISRPWRRLFRLAVLHRALFL